MVNQPISTSIKPNVDLWIYNDAFLKNIQDYFIDVFKRHSNIKIKKIGVDVVNDNVINIAPIVCPDIQSLKQEISNIDDNLYQFCHNNNIKMLFSLTRETIDRYQCDDVVDLVRRDIILQGYTSKTVKILYVAEEVISGLNRIKDYLICCNYFNTILASIISTKFANQTYQKSENRPYNFSLLTGQLIGRPDRIIFLAKAHNQKILQSDFFYTVHLPDKEELLYYVNTFMSRDICNIIQDDVFNNYTVDNLGNELLDKTIYKSQIEYSIPKQMLDSHINIVLETQPDTPFLTEKIYKPLMAGILFLWHGPVNTLQYLENMGFKRYKNIDYSFDNHTNVNTRLDLLLKEIQRLKNEDLVALTALNQNAIEYNQRRFWQISNNMDQFWDQIK